MKREQGRRGEYVGERVGLVVSVPVGCVASVAAVAGRGVEARVAAGAGVEVSEGTGVVVEFAPHVGTPIKISPGVDVRRTAMDGVGFDGAHATVNRRSQHVAISLIRVTECLSAALTVLANAPNPPSTTLLYHKKSEKFIRNLFGSGISMKVTVAMLNLTVLTKRDILVYCRIE
jgi:hypothetical protein